MEFLSSLFYFVIVIGILVVIHEFGHFIAARLSGIRVDVFSVGMGNRLFGYNKKTGFTFGKLPADWTSDGLTDYRLSLFPIGGYVKVVGMVDESMDVEFAKTEPQPWEFRSKGMITKIFVMSFGVIMNIILAIGIFAGIALTSGVSLWKTTEIGYVGNNSLGQKIGFMVDDKIQSINGRAVNTWDDVMENLTMEDFGKPKEITVLRNGRITTLNADGGAIVKAAVTGEDVLAITPKYLKIALSGVETIMPAGKAGLKSGDEIVSLNGEKIFSHSQFISTIKSHKNKPVDLVWSRKGRTYSASVTPNSDGLIGVTIIPDYTGPVIHKSYNIIEALGRGVTDTYRTVQLFVGSVVQIFQGKISFRQSMGGPLMIAKVAKKQAENGLVDFLHFMALLSVTLAVINILPFPALDGGHIVFVLVEGIIRKEIPIKVKMVIQQFGIAVLLILMAFIFYNDLTR